LENAHEIRIFMYMKNENVSKVGEILYTIIGFIVIVCLIGFIGGNKDK